MLLHSSKNVGVAGLCLTIYTLYQNFPNPLNPSTIIFFGLPRASMVTLKVYNDLGQEVVSLVQKALPAGYHSVRFDLGNMPSGVYLYRIQARPLDSAIGRDSGSGAGDFVQTRKLIVLR